MSIEEVVNELRLDSHERGPPLSEVQKNERMCLVYKSQEEGMVRVKIAKVEATS